MNTPLRTLALTVAVVVLLPLAACATPGPPVEGKVIEEGSNKPIPNTIVVARWTEAITLVFDSRTRCVHVESTVTDNEGRFQLPRHKGKAPNHLDTYKPGYERSEQYYKTQAYLRYTDILRPSTLSRGERLDYLLRVSSATGCGGSGHSEKNLLPLYRALYEEAKAIAVPEHDYRKVEILLFGLESLEVGSMEALNRMTERRKVKK